MSEIYKPKGLAVPASRFSRAARLGGLTTSILGNMALSGTRALASGQRPVARDLLLTPANAKRITQQLAQMRGAAMKVGQLMSMEAGDLLPPELAEILGHLRSDAHFMPPGQLKQVLVRNWGADFQQRFSKFNVRPIAAASIGQVHRAQARDGRDLAIKVQYPGVRGSIDSDVRNVASLLRLSGLLPKAVDIAPLLDEAQRQLHEEADYERESRFLARFGALLAQDDRFVVPEAHPDLTTRDILAMTFVPGVAIESLEDAPQDVRDRVMTELVELMLQELFAFGVMQTDPNFANYRYDPESGRIVLLDFGAARDLSGPLRDRFLRLLHAAMAQDEPVIRKVAIEIGYFDETTAPHHQEAMMGLFRMALAPLLSPEPFDFGDTALAGQLRDAGMALGAERDFWHIPPMEVLYVQRKIAGIYLLAARLRAKVHILPLLEPYSESNTRRLSSSVPEAKDPEAV